MKWFRCLGTFNQDVKHLHETLRVVWPEVVFHAWSESQHNVRTRPVEADILLENYLDFTGVKTEVVVKGGVDRTS